MTNQKGKCPFSNGSKYEESPSLRSAYQHDPEIMKTLDYRNIFGPPESEAEFYWGILENSSSKTDSTLKVQDRKATRTMLKKLAKRMRSKPNRDTKPTDGDDKKSTQHIPAGYTYLAQLVAHDMVQSVASLDAFANTEGIPRNFRKSALVLDTIYGGGPLASPLAYAVDNLKKEVDQRRTRLRLSQSDEYKLNDKDPSQYRDIGRFFPPVHFGKKVSVDGDDYRKVGPGVLNDAAPKKIPSKHCGNALISDPRNDDNVFISQLCALFHMLHNKVSTELSKLDKSCDASLKPKNRLHQFRIARQIVIAVYRQVVHQDLLQKLLCESVYKKYEERFKSNSAYIDKSADGRIPVEFSHAAFRFGHAMIRNHYTINNQLKTFGRGVGGLSLKNALRTTSHGGLAHFVPFDRKWRIQWQHFFDFRNYSSASGKSPVTPQFANRIEPFFVEELASRGIVSHFDSGDAGGLDVRDLKQSADIGTRSVTSLYDKMGSDAAPEKTVLWDANERKKAIREWLQGSDNAEGFSPQELDSLSDDPPLSFYVLFEADYEADGKTLGTLGSVILAETIYAALTASKSMFESNDSLQSVMQKIFLSGIPESMPALISYVAGTEGFGDLITGDFSGAETS